MIKCPNPDCGYENVDGTQFCEGCGEELPQNSGAAATSTTAAVGANTPIHGAASAASADQIRCPACENLNPADNVVCEVCGTELHPGAASAGAATASPSVAATSSTGTASAASIPTADSLATGTATPADSALLSGSSAVTASSGATASDATPSALSSSSPVTADTAVFSSPVVAAGDTTSGISPTGTTLPSGDAALTTPSSTSTPIAGGIASSDPVSVSATSAVDTSATASTATPSSNLQPGHVKLTVEQGMTIGKQFVLGDPEILVGREDDEEGIYPDVDLSDQDEGYVHRKHAQLKFENGGLTVTHLGGANRTRVNNKPLDDNTPQAVNIGDKVSFGKVVMRVGSV